MCEFMAARLPILTTPFGARGVQLEDGRTGFFFERAELAPALLRVRRLFDHDAAGLRRVAERAYAENIDVVDMERGVRPLVEALVARGNEACIGPN
jgi:hypothetical protein